MRTPIRSSGWLAISLAGLALAPSARAQSADLTQKAFTSTMAHIEQAPGWYDDVNYGAAPAGLGSLKHYKPDGIQFPSYILFLEAGLETTYDDNIHATPDHRTDDFRSLGSVSLTALSRLPRHLFNIYLDARYTNYAEQSGDDYIDGRAAVDWRLDVDHGHAIGGRLASDYHHEDQLSPEAPLAAREAVPVLSNEAEIALTRDQGRLGATLGLDAADYDYSDVEAFDGSRIDQDFRDMTSYGAYLGLNYRFSPGYRLLTSIRAGREIYHDAEAELRNATVYQGKVGLAFEISPLWRAYASVGYGLADYDRESRDRFGAFVYDARLQWLASPLLTMTLSAGRAIEEASFGGEGAILETHAEVEAKYEVMRNLMLTAAVGYEQDEITGSDRVDDTYIGRIGVEYTINKNVLFTLGYQRGERFSTDSNYDMQSNRYTAGLKIRF